jgi:hypothetical protein
MMEVLSVRVPKELKDHMKEVDFNWSKEIRQFIEERVHAYQKVNDEPRVHRRL